MRNIIYVLLILGFEIQAQDPRLIFLPKDPIDDIQIVNDRIWVGDKITTADYTGFEAFPTEIPSGVSRGTGNLFSLNTESGHVGEIDESFGFNQVFDAFLPDDPIRIGDNYYYIRFRDVNKYNATDGITTVLEDVTIRHLFKRGDNLCVDIGVDMGVRIVEINPSDQVKVDTTFFFDNDSATELPYFVGDFDALGDSLVAYRVEGLVTDSIGLYVLVEETWKQLLTGYTISHIEVGEINGERVIVFSGDDPDDAPGLGIFWPDRSEPEDPNTKPEITSPATASATEDLEFSYTITATDSEGDPITLIVGNISSWLTFDGTNTVIGTPLEGTETGTFRVIAQDPEMLADTLVVSIVVDPVDDKPTLDNPLADFDVLQSAADTAIYVLDVFSDIDSEIALSVSTESDLVSPALDGDSLRVAFSSTSFGSAEIVLIGSSGDYTVTDTFEVYIDDRIDIKTPLEDLTIDQGITQVTIDFSMAFEDLDTEIAYTVSTMGGTFSPTLSSTDVVLDFDTSKSGSAELYLTGTSNGISLTDTVIVLVNALAWQFPELEVFEDSTHRFPVKDWLSHREVIEVISVTNGQLVIEDDTANVTGNQDYFGEMSVVLSSLAGETTLTIPVLAVNDAPEISGVNYDSQITEQTTSLTVSTSDIDNESLTVQLLAGSNLIDEKSIDANTEAVFDLNSSIVAPGTEALLLVLSDGDLDDEMTLQVEVEEVITGLDPASDHKIQAYPNPFTRSITLSYFLTSRQRVIISLYDAQGRIVKTLISEIQNTGDREISYDGQGLDPGMYFYEIQTHGKRTMKRIFKH